MVLSVGSRRTFNILCRRLNSIRGTTIGRTIGTRCFGDTIHRSKAIILSPRHVATVGLAKRCFVRLCNSGPGLSRAHSRFTVGSGALPRLGSHVSVTQFFF